MAYVDYDYYHNTYMGTVGEEDFERLAVRASSYLDYYTMGKAAAAADTDPVKMCCCALVDKYAIIETAQALAAKSISAAGASAVKSETVGGYSRTLATGGESANAALSTLEEAKKALPGVCVEYLAYTGLLYRGRGCGCCTPPTP